MYKILPDEKTGDPAIKKPVEKKVNDVLQGTPSRPFGLYDFLIVHTALTLYMFFTGMCLLFGRKLPKGWLALSDIKRDTSLVDAVVEKVKSKKKPTKHYVWTMR